MGHGASLAPRPARTARPLGRNRVHPPWGQHSAAGKRAGWAGILPLQGWQDLRLQTWREIIYSSESYTKAPQQPASQALAFMVISDELPTMPGQAQAVLGPDPKLIFICSCVSNFAPSHSSSINSGTGGWAGAEGTLGVRQRVFIKSLEPTWRQPPGPKRVEREGVCEAGAKGSLETTKNGSWQARGWKTGRKEEEEPGGEERDHRPMSGV